MFLVVTSLSIINSSATKNSIINDIQNYEFVPGEFIVKFTKDTEIISPYIAKLNEKYQINSMEKLFKNCQNTTLENIYLIGFSEDSDVLSIVNDYSSKSYVEYAEPNYIVHSCVIPNDEKFGKQWALHNIGQNGGLPDADIDATEAWDIETGNSQVIIAIIDSGVDYNHPDLTDNIWINEDEILGNEIDDDSNGYIDDIFGWDFFNNDNDPLDAFGHGTFCSGIASGLTNNSNGIAGVCWHCKIMTVQTLNKSGHGTLIDVANGIKYATDNGADVISISLGLYTYSYSLKNTVEYAYSKGIFMCAAAGNDGVLDKFYPAAYENVVAVAATDNNDSKMSYYYEVWDSWCISNYGDWIDVAAPGEFIYSIMPPYNVWLTDYGFKKNYDYLTGTSMAAPHVAGLAALVLSKNPFYSPVNLRLIIRANVDPYVSEQYIGTGRINAYKTLIEYNTQPNIPTINGPLFGRKGKEYEYSLFTIDPDEDDIKYYINWGDGNTEWTDYYKSSEVIKVKHIWMEMKTIYIIKVKAHDIKSGESDWAEFKVIIPRYKISMNILFKWIIDNFSLLERIVLNLK